MDFLTSLAIICLSALLLGSICSKIKLPPLLGMLIVGIIMGPYLLDLIAPSILNISADLRKLALIIILTRAGLNLNLKDLKKKRTFRRSALFSPRKRRDPRLHSVRFPVPQTRRAGRGNPRLRHSGGLACGRRSPHAATERDRIRNG